MALYSLDMLLWILMALMTGAAVLTVLWPLSKISARTEPDGDVPFYKAQLAEIDRDRDRGFLDPATADAARIESSRRLLRAAERRPDIVDATSEPALRRRRAASALALSVIPIVSLALYGGFGSPQMPGRPVVAREEARPKTDDVSVALRRVEEHLSANPNDVRGWDIVAPIYLRLGRLADAARAFRQARTLAGDTPERLLGEGEALVGASDGVIEDEARALFDRVVALEPSSPAGRYYVALAAEQGGRNDAAKDGYRSLLETSKPDAPWVPLVRARLARLEGGQAPAPLAPSAVTPEIAAMVSGLDDRLMQNGGNEAEWLRLIRSLVVLGRREDAADRLVRARTALAGDRDAIGRVDDLARDLGLRAEVARR